MRILALLTAAAIGLGLVPSARSGQLTGRPVGPELPKSPPPAPVACGSYGTSVDFVDTPADAAKQAKKEQKLVLVLHVSGQFENAGLT